MILLFMSCCMSCPFTLICVCSGLDVNLGSSSCQRVSVHNVSTLKHSHLQVILKKLLSPKLITITVTSNGI